MANVAVDKLQWVNDVMKKMKRDHSRAIKIVREKALQERLKLKSSYDKELSEMRKLLEQNTQHSNQFQSQHGQLLQEIEEVLG
jgi:hypothetical protein